MQPSSLLEDIFRIISDSHGPEATLESIVKLVAERLDIDVCSVYLLDEHKKHLVLRATVGLRSESVGRIKMRIDQGLTGWALEKMAPVFAVQPASHPRYKYFENSGEEAYQTFLGLPLVYHQKTLGVLVAQTVAPDGIRNDQLGVFSAVASQIAATVAYSGLLEDFARERSQHLDLKQRLSVTDTGLSRKKRLNKQVLRGTPVSAGVGVGVAHYLTESIGFDQIECQLPEDPIIEERRLDEAIGKTLAQIQSLIERMKDLSTGDAAILEVHRMLVQDHRFRKRLSDVITQSVCAEYALKQVVRETMEQFMQIDDPYLRERASDIEDLGKRILRNLLKLEREETEAFDQPTIVIASDISPVDLIALRQKNLAGIVLFRGGKTSHAVLLAKSFEIPTITGAKHVVAMVREKDRLILDGTSGLIFRNPPAPIEEEYQRLKHEKNVRDRSLDRLRDLPASTADGVAIALGANISLLSDLELVDRCGADHIGLYRTEFPFLVRRSFPTEAEQFELYSKIVDGSANRTVTFRTLDVGGDKFLSYLDYPKEENPYLGWRSVRVSLELDHVFRTQLRAILQASSRGKAKVLFPMITSTRELLKILAMLEEEKQGLKHRSLDFDEDIPIGIMLEVPGTVKILGSILKHVDFVSIGTNDLIQYALAVDRNNEKVAALYNPLHPAVISIIAEVAGICRQHAKPVAICGDAAANPACALLYLGMRVDHLSMNPVAIPSIKHLIRSTSLAQAKDALQAVLQMEDEQQIADYLDDVCNRIGLHDQPS